MINVGRPTEMNVQVFLLFAHARSVAMLIEGIVEGHKKIRKNRKEKGKVRQVEPSVQASQLSSLGARSLVTLESLNHLVFLARCNKAVAVQNLPQAVDG